MPLVSGIAFAYCRPLLRCIRLSESTTPKSLVEPAICESLAIVPDELISLWMVALLFLVAMKSAHSAIRAVVAGRLDFGMPAKAALVEEAMDSGFSAHGLKSS